MYRLKPRTRQKFGSLQGATLLEAIVAAVLFLTVFAAVTELVPRLTLRDDDALLVAEAEYRTLRMCEKYATGLWPCDTYIESCDWGRIEVEITPYRDYDDLQVVTLRARIDGSRKRINHKQLIECAQ